MITLVKQGAFDADAVNAINANFMQFGNAILPQPNPVVYVDTVNGLEVNDGTNWVTPQTPQTRQGPVQTMARALTLVRSNGVIAVVGKIREQVVAPLGIYNVSIIGAVANPHHDLAASWLYPVSPVAATPLIRLREQGWGFRNMLFQGYTDAAAVMLKRREDATDPDASHAWFENCRWSEGFIHIEDNGGCFNVRINGCTFMLATGTGGGAIKSTSTTVALPYKWVITNSNFQNNVNHIVMPFNKAIIGFRGKGNTFSGATTAVINLTGGTAPNMVVDNAFDIAAADFDPAGGVTGVTGDTWSNTLSDAIETGLPAN